ncbi:uncharacterized protein LOC116211981 isoform X1 [Punica granatum]|uniref:Uncharacterized protein LOC116211981 isoform X1 n=1 Tax=Punica granatum TaxID=22663 RepID=A0A6P8E4J7_PUNGR|nr:uncharacterized protein LOC116211981 isoform X1 [Punica granatum]
MVFYRKAVWISPIQSRQASVPTAAEDSESAIAMATAIGAQGGQLVGYFEDLSVQDLEDEQSSVRCGKHGEVCAICLDKIELEETALIKGCEHAYCVTCILRWATYKEKPTCPQCKHPLEFLNVHRSLDGSLHDYMLEESVCLLLRAMWFNPLVVEDYGNMYDDLEDYIPYEDETFYDYDYSYEDDDGNLDEDDYFNVSPGLRIGNRRWGENGYVRAGRQEARPICQSNFSDSGSSSSSSSRQPKKKEAPKKEATGRRAKRALKREAADKAAAAKREVAGKAAAANREMHLAVSGGE